MLSQSRSQWASSSTSRARTVQGFGHPGLIDYPVKITAWNEVTVAFSGSLDIKSSMLSTTGTIDRVTGDVEAHLGGDGLENVKDRNIHKLRAEMQANTTDVLREPTESACGKRRAGQ